MSITTSNTTCQPGSLALVMMVKNEKKRIKISLESVKNFVDKFVIMDTGSEDDTIKIIKDFCEENKKELFLFEKTFPQPFHYSKARNAILEFADDKADFLLLLDCNDELRDGEKLQSFVRNYSGKCTAFHICQEWWNGSSLDKYYNIRLIRSGNGWIYKGAIHEYICNPKYEEDTIKRDSMVCRLIGFVLYQDRTQDDDKTSKRFERDEKVFESEYTSNIENKIIPQDSRTVFYYGQTCSCLRKHEKAYRLYRERCDLEGFNEERYHAYYRCGDLSMILNHDWEESFLWYIKAFEYSAQNFDIPRAEPLFKIAHYYKERCPQLSFLYIKRCCEIGYPNNAILFVERRTYDYCRWNLLADVCSRIKEMNIGRVACMKAISSEKKEEDLEMLERYIGDKKERDDVITRLKAGEDPLTASGTTTSGTTTSGTTTSGTTTSGTTTSDSGRSHDSKKREQRKRENIQKLRKRK